MPANVNHKAPLIMVSVAFGFVCGMLVSLVLPASSMSEAAPGSVPSASATPIPVASPALVTVAPGVGHLLPLEVADWVNGHIARFITTRLQELRPAA